MANPQAQEFGRSADGVGEIADWKFAHAFGIPERLIYLGWAGTVDLPGERANPFLQRLEPER